MASKRRVRRKHCGNKVKYASVEEANPTLFSLIRNRTENGTKLQIYKCKFCGSFHIGHENLRQKQARIAKTKAAT